MAIVALYFYGALMLQLQGNVNLGFSSVGQSVLPVLPCQICEKLSLVPGRPSHHQFARQTENTENMMLMMFMV